MHEQPAHPFRTRRTAAMTAGLVLALLVGGFAAFAGGDDGASAEMPDGAVATINGLAVSEAEWAALLAQHEAVVDQFEQHLQQDDAAAGGAPEDEAVQSILDRLESHPAEAVVLAELLEDNVMIAETRDRGLTLDEDEVAALSAETRESTESFLAGSSNDPGGNDSTPMPGDRAVLEAEIAAAGEAAYWDEVVPARSRSLVARGLLWTDVDPEVQGDWQHFHRDLVEDAEVHIAPHIAATVTVDEALAYLDEAAPAGPPSPGLPAQGQPTPPAGPPPAGAP